MKLIKSSKGLHGMRLGTKLAVLLSISLLITSCAGPVERAEEYSTQNEWNKAVMEYRKAVLDKPRDVEYRSRLKQTEQKAADYYYQRGMNQLDHNNLDAAIELFQQGLVAMPDYPKLLQAISTTAARKEADTLYKQAKLSVEGGKEEEAVKSLKRALDFYPDHKAAIALLSEIGAEGKQKQSADKLTLSSRAPITLNFRQTDLRTSFEFIAKSFGVDVIFDEAVRSAPVTLFAKDVTFEQALNLLLATSKTFYKQIGPNTILVAPDTKEKRAQYEDQFIRTIQLSSITAKEMSDIVKGLINVKKMIINEQLNVLVVRDTADVLKVVDKIVEANDRRAAELILEVEILEVNRTKAEHLGLDLGSYSVKASIPSTTTIPTAGSIPDNVSNAGVLTLPSVTFNFYKQDVDAKILANPKIRVLSGKSAKIHIGDRVPLRAATIQDATGQVRTTYDYKDVGIRLNAEPVVHLDNSVSVKVGLEVSALGENLGTQSEPAYRIGTRNAETFMILRDGETAILGGLIRDEDRATRVGIPGLGDIPAIGSIFSSHDNSTGRTDVLLTITPRVVRGKDFPGKDLQNFVSGTEDHYMTEKVFGDLTAPEKGEAGATRTNTDSEPVTTPQSQPNQPLSDNNAQATTDIVPAVNTTTASKALLSFKQPVYEKNTGQEFQVELTGEQLSNVVDMPIELLFNPQLISFVKADQGDIAKATDFSTDGEPSRGTLAMTIKYGEQNPANGSGVIAKLTMRAEKSGTSYLVYRTKPLSTSDGSTITPQVRASRVVIK